MTKKEFYKNIIRQTIEKKDENTLDLIAQIIFESDQAKQELRNKGYGYTGLSLLLTVQEEVPIKEKV